MNEQDEAAEIPATVSQANTLLGLLGLLVLLSFLLLLIVALTERPFDFGFAIVSVLGCLFGLWGIILACRLSSRKRSVQIQVFGWTYFAGAYSIYVVALSLIYRTFYGLSEDLADIYNGVFFGVLALLAISALAAMMSKTARNWFR